MRAPVELFLTLAVLLVGCKENPSGKPPERASELPPVITAALGKIGLLEGPLFESEVMEGLGFDTSIEGVGDIVPDSGSGTESGSSWNRYAIGFGDEYVLDVTGSIWGARWEEGSIWSDNRVSRIEIRVKDRDAEHGYRTLEPVWERPDSEPEE